jgi:hypothetical protein
LKETKFETGKYEKVKCCQSTKWLNAVPLERGGFDLQKPVLSKQKPVLQPEIQSIEKSTFPEFT